MNESLLNADDGYGPQGDDDQHQSPILDGRLSRYSNVFEGADEEAWDMCFVVPLKGWGLSYVIFYDCMVETMPRV